MMKEEEINSKGNTKESKKGIRHTHNKGIRNPEEKRKDRIKGIVMEHNKGRLMKSQRNS
jgi:hypothetical protein